MGSLEIEQFPVLPGNTFRIGSDTMRMRVRGENTFNAYLCLEHYLPPGGEGMPMSHFMMQETYYILEGELTMKSYGPHQSILNHLVKKGSFVYFPIFLSHAYFNEGKQACRFLRFVMPPGRMEEFIKKVGEPVEEFENHKLYPLDLEKVKFYAKDYGITIQ